METYLTIQKGSNIGICSHCRIKVHSADWHRHECAPQIKDILGSSKSNFIKDNFDNVQDIPLHKTFQAMDAVQDKFIAKLYECVASHYENGDRIGAEAILNAIQYSQQEN